MANVNAPVFAPGPVPSTWIPCEFAQGPFAGLQGGAVAGLLAAEIEIEALARGWGQAITANVSFLRAAPLSTLQTRWRPVDTGGRLTVIENILLAEGDTRPLAISQITLCKPRSIASPELSNPRQSRIDPTRFELQEPRAPHGRPWFMDVMEVRKGPQIVWFRQRHPLIQGAGALSRLLGPADWAHGINRPTSSPVADPNPNLSVHMLRPAEGEWIGVEAETHWQLETGVGLGGGSLHDVNGVVGRVAMSVALTPFRHPQ